MTARRALLALALVVGLAHLPFLATTLEDIDSVNFALGVRAFDVAEHRPHPPGYPVYIGLGKLAVAVAGLVTPAAPPSRLEASALAMLSLLAAVACVWLLYRVFAAMQPERDPLPPWQRLDPLALSAVALTLSSPLVWTMTVRPMSDLPGLTLALAAQACLLTAWWWQTAGADGDRRMDAETLAASGGMIVLGALVAGLAVGLRTQTLWLTAPLLLLVLADRIGRGVAGAILGALMTFTIGALAWAVPLVVASGGLQGYLTALGSQAGEDFAGGEMLYLNPAPRLIATALMHTFLDPWDVVPLGIAMLVLAAAGVVRLLLHDRRTLAVVAVLALPYLAFHLLFQDTSFIRYAMPLVPVVCLLAVHGVALASAQAVAPVAAVLSLAAVAVAVPTTAEYASTEAPAVQAVAAINAEASAAPPAALAMHQTFRRPLEAEVVAIEPPLPSPPRREWLELARFWMDGSTGPVWFLADPRRTDLALVDPQSRLDVVPFRWAPAERPVFGGMRPAAVDWVRLPTPRWFAEEGWALTPETAGVARLMGRGPHLGPITARVRRDPSAMRVLIGGRNLAGPSDPAARFTLAVDGRPLQQWDVAPGFFLRAIDLPAGTLTGEGMWAALTVQSSPAAGEAPIPTAVEQFDLQAPGTLMWAFDRGWHEAEYTPARGLWHWMSGQADLHIDQASAPVRVTITAESPLRYFDTPSVVTARVGEVEVGRATLGVLGVFTFEVPRAALEAAGGRVTLETSQTFVPAERGAGSDARRLGLRVESVRVELVGLR